MTLKNLEDDLLDENSILKRALYRKLSRNKRYISYFEENKDVLQQLNHQIKRLHKLENQKENFDILTNSFGDFFIKILDAYLEIYQFKKPDGYKNLREIFFNVGKLIYILDAYDDYYEDKVKDDFNLLDEFFTKDESANKEKTHEKIDFICRTLLFKIHQAFVNMNWKINEDILLNILTYGNIDVFNHILKTRYSNHLN